MAAMAGETHAGMVGPQPTPRQGLRGHPGSRRPRAVANRDAMIERRGLVLPYTAAEFPAPEFQLPERAVRGAFPRPEVSAGKLVPQEGSKYRQAL